MAIGKEEAVKGAAVTALAFWLLRKLAKDLGREAERLGQRTCADVDSGKAIEAIRAETDLILLKVSDSMQASLQHLAASSRLHCKLQGASLFCEIEPKDLPHNNGASQSISHKDCSKKN